jgi:anti-anti-sigma factor
VSGERKTGRVRPHFASPNNSEGQTNFTCFSGFFANLPPQQLLRVSSCPIAIYLAESTTMNLEQRQLESGGVVIELEGEADLAAAPAFQEVIRDLMQKEIPLLVVDFSKVTFVNTPVWAVLIEYYQHTTKKDLKFAISGLTGRVEASFNIVRLGDFIRHFPDVDAAVAAMG